jgi:ABC-type uncharacterized transport system involved in gliding motility auxiliary subunit
MNNKFTPLIGLLIAAVLLVGINLISAKLLEGSRVDLTQQKLYTLTEGTRSILRDLEEPIRLQLYFTRRVGGDIPVFNNYHTRVREMLQEYRNIAGDKLQLEFIDPEPFSEQEDEAALAGLQGVPAMRPDEPMFFGLVGKNSIDNTEVIPFFAPEREEFLEYDVSRLIYNLAHPKRPVLGLITTLPIQGDQDPMAGFTGQQVREPWVIYEQLRQLYDVRDLGRDIDEVDEDVDVLLVVHPKQLPAQTLYAIDQFVLGGGHTIAFVDPHAEAEIPRQEPGNPMAALFAPRDSNLEPLLGKWGLRLADKVVAGDRRYATMVTMRDQRGVPQPTNYVAYLSLTPEALNSEDVVTGDLQILTLGSAGILERLESVEGLTITPLIETSPESMHINVEDIRIQPKPQELLQNFVSLDKKLMLAARITGRASTAYPDGPPEREEFFDPSQTPPGMNMPFNFPGGADPEPGSEAEEALIEAANGEEAEAEPAREIPESHLAQSKGDINVIVVADVDMLADPFWVQTVNILGQRIATPRAGNGSFLLNAVENLAGSSELISIRSRGTMNRPFTRVQEIAKEAQEQYQDRERRLEERLEELQQELNQIAKQTGEQGVDAIGEVAELQRKAREEMVQTRKELRDVRRELNREVDRLGNRLRWLNVALIPALVTAIAIGTGIVRINRRKSAV